MDISGFQTDQEDPIDLKTAAKVKVRQKNDRILIVIGDSSNKPCKSIRATTCLIISFPA
jgi:hypothetical protein